MLRHLLIDLDGTLLGLRMEEFIPLMTASMEEHFRPHVGAGRFLEALREGLRSMVSSADPSLTVMEAFLGRFCPEAGLPPEDAARLFEDYYRGPFTGLKGRASAVEGAEELVSVALELGLKLTLATNPIFPMAAIRERLGWAGLAESSFGLITSAERMHWCKPRPEYFLEALLLSGTGAGESLMAGNDRVQDLAAGQAGLGTFLVEEGFTAGTREASRADWRGTLANLSRLLRRLAG